MTKEERDIQRKPNVPGHAGKLGDAGKTWCPAINPDGRQACPELGRRVPLTSIGKLNEKIRRFQYTAIDDATRVRALKVYHKHTQADGQDLVDHIIENFPFRIKKIRTDNGREFEAKFHWHVEDQGIHYAYIKSGTP